MSKIFKCKCGGHAIEIDKWEEEDFCEIFLNYWHMAGLYDNSWIERLKMIWHILKGSKYLYWDIILNKKQAKELGEYLIKILEDNSSL
jgi:hypothetical protein